MSSIYCVGERTHFVEVPSIFLYLKVPRLFHISDNDPLETLILKVNALHHYHAVDSSLTRKKDTKKESKTEAVKAPVEKKKSLKDSKSSKAKKSSSKNSTHSTGAQGDSAILADIPVNLILELFRER